jgi:hypothetical protein
VVEHGRQALAAYGRCRGVTLQDVNTSKRVILPHADRPGIGVPGGRKLACGPRCPGALTQVSEGEQVQFPRFGLKPVSDAIRHEHSGTATRWVTGIQLAAQPAYICLDQVHRGYRRVSSPECIDNRLTADAAARVKGKQAKNGALPRRSGLDLFAVKLEHERAENLQAENSAR